MASIEWHERVAFLKGTCVQMNERLTTLQWMVGLSITWNTLLIGAAVGITLMYA